MADYLPEEVVSDIFLRLPIKDLIRVRCVCKKWLAFISSPSFITLHLNQSTASNKDLLLFRYRQNSELRTCPLQGRQERFFLCPDDIFPCGPREEVECPYKPKFNDYVNIVASCDGVICLADDVRHYSTNRDDWALLWNPSIRKTVTIPPPNVTLKTHGFYEHSLCFGYDSVSSDYKLVRMVHLNNCSEGEPDSRNVLVEVYALKNRCWRMAASGLQYLFVHRRSLALSNGTCLWLAHSSQKERCRSALILTLSLGNEEVGEIQLPNFGGFSTLFHCNLAASWDGCLSIVKLNDKSPEEFCEIWVMKEYGVVASWAKLFSVKNVQILQWSTSLLRERFVAFKKSGQVLLADEDGHLMLYNPKNGEHELTNLMGESSAVCCSVRCCHAFYLDVYKESLALLDVQDQTSGRARKRMKGTQWDRMELQLQE